jgi:phosphate transport system protein
MIRTGVDALVRRNLEQARQLPFMDEPVDRLNRNMYKEVVDCGPDPQVLEWATRMMMVSRALERIGDQVVDIAEQTAFLLTGEMMEFTEEALTGSTDDGE